ncbi:MAG: transporter substrate-binding domain-containing protein, partial [Lachnospiraceae bacterium]
MKKLTLARKLLVVAVSVAMTTMMLAGCKSNENASEKKVLRVGMECAYAPFNWTQDAATTPDGTTAVKIYGSDFYAYGYDVAVAKMIAEQMGYDLEIHKVEWSSIGISMDAGDYDCIIAGMGRTAEREKAYSFTDPYYYRDNCIVVKKGSAYEGVTGLSQLQGTGCRLTTQLGTGWIPLLDQVDGAVTGFNYETTSECFMAIMNDVADVCIVDLPTAKSAALTNEGLVIIELDPEDSFTGDDEMVNVCIATRKNDT